MVGYFDILGENDANAKIGYTKVFSKQMCP